MVNAGMESVKHAISEELPCSYMGRRSSLRRERVYKATGSKRTTPVLFESELTLFTHQLHPAHDPRGVPFGGREFIR